MNRIRPTRLILAGLATLLAFVGIDLLWEGLIGAVDLVVMQSVMIEALIIGMIT